MADQIRMTKKIVLNQNRINMKLIALLWTIFANDIYFPLIAQDFLFPRSLRSRYSPHRAFSHLLPPVDSGRPLFPPVRHLSFHSPVVTCPDNHLKVSTTGETNHMPPVSTSMRLALPPADELQKLQPIQLPVGSGLKLQPSLQRPTR